MAWLNARGMKSDELTLGLIIKKRLCCPHPLTIRFRPSFLRAIIKPVFIINLLLVYKLFFKKIVVEARSLS